MPQFALLVAEKRLLIIFSHPPPSEAFFCTMRRLSKIPLHAAAKPIQPRGAEILDPALEGAVVRNC